MAENKKQKVQKLSSEEAELDEAHIPVSLRDPVLRMSAEDAIIENIPTVFVGVVDKDYSDNMWKKHVDRMSHLFRIDANYVCEIKVKNLGNSQIDAVQLGLDMTAAIDVMNSRVFQAIRIVGLGIHSAIAVHDALESLVRGWNLLPENKIVQFVALGDSKESDYLILCKALCLKKICGCVQFYTTMDYNNFGFLDLSNNALCRRLASPERLEQLTKRLADSKVSK